MLASTVKFWTGSLTGSGSFCGLLAGVASPGDVVSEGDLDVGTFSSFSLRAKMS